MADRHWITRVVSTKGYYCPKMRARCPGRREGRRGCAFWLDEIITGPGGTAPELQGGCLFVWDYVLKHEEVLETKRGIESTNQTAATQAAGIAAALSRPAETRIVVMPVDAGHVEKLVALMNGQRAALPEQGTAPSVPSGDG